MPIYFSSEDGKNYEYDLGLTSSENKFRFDRQTYKSKILSDIDYNDNTVDKYDKVAVFKNTIENYFNRNLKYLNFSSMKEVNNIVSSGITTVNGATFDKYYEASYLSNWKKDIDTLVADATNKFVDGVTGLPNLTSFVRELRPSPIYFEGITGSYYRNFFNDKNYNVLTDYENEGRVGQLSPLVIEEITKGLSASLTGRGPIDGECLSGGADDILSFSEQPEIIRYKFPTIHTWGFEPSEKIFNFINDPSDQNMLEAFFGAGEDGIIAAAHIAGQTFGSTSQGIYGLPFPVISLTGGVIGQNGETGNVFNSMFVEGSTAGKDTFNMNILPDGLSSENIEQFTKLTDPLDYPGLRRQLDIREENFNRWIKKYCAKLTNNADNTESPHLIPGIGDPVFDDPGFTGTFEDLFGEFGEGDRRGGERLIPILKDTFPPALWPRALEGEFDPSFMEKLRKLGLIFNDSLWGRCLDMEVDCEDVNWYDPITNPCGYASLSQCCRHTVRTSIGFDFDFYRPDGTICNIGDGDYNPFIFPDVFFRIGQPEFGISCTNCIPPNPWNPTDSPCYETVGELCIRDDTINTVSVSEEAFFDHSIKMHFTGECLLAIIEKLRDKCPRLYDRWPRGFRWLNPSGERGPSSATLTIRITIQLVTKLDQYFLYASNCGCYGCPCTNQACVASDPDCVQKRIPELIRPPSGSA